MLYGILSFSVIHKSSWWKQSLIIQSMIIYWWHDHHKQETNQSIDKLTIYKRFCEGFNLTLASKVVSFELEEKDKHTVGQQTINKYSVFEKSIKLGITNFNMWPVYSCISDYVQTISRASLPRLLQSAVCQRPHCDCVGGITSKGKDLCCKEIGALPQLDWY